MIPTTANNSQQEHGDPRLLGSDMPNAVCSIDSLGHVLHTAQVALHVNLGIETSHTTTELVAMPFAPSSVLAPSSKARSP